MKTKAIIALLIVFLVGAALKKHSSTAKSESKAPVSSPVVEAVNPHEVLAVATKSVVAPESAKPVSENPEAHLQGLLIGQPSLQELDHEFKNYKKADLQQAYHESQKTIQALHLMEKAQTDSLNDQERVRLALEMRKQAVLQHLLVRADLERIKRKYL